MLDPVGANNVTLSPKQKDVEPLAVIEDGGDWFTLIVSALVDCREQLLPSVISTV